MAFELDYRLVGHGWAAASASDGERHVAFDVSYLSDALSDFAAAVDAILRGADDAACRFEDEPGSHVLVFTRRFDDVLVELHRSADNFAPGPVGRPILVATIGRSSLATLAINVLRRVLDEWGEAGYRDHWGGKAFPMRRYRALLAVRRSLRSQGV